MNAHSPIIQSRDLKDLSILQPWRTVAALAFDWLVIAAAIAISEYAGSIVVYLCSAAVIAGRMHGLGVLMHESAHYRFSKNRKLGDWVGDLFAAWPIMATVDGYRQNHLAHHQNTNTVDDPDWVVKLGTVAFTFPQKAWTAVLHLLGYVVAINSVRDLAHILPRISKNDRSTRGYKLARIGFYLFWAAVFTYFGIWTEALIYWIVPYFTLLFLFLHVRSVAEHFGSMDYEQELGSTRTIKPYFWERWFFAPHNINYHLEHHLYPGVPFYNLPKLHEVLMRNGHYSSNAHLTRGYSTGLVRECLA